MTALMRSADARLSASTMISSSIRLSLVGAQVLCTTKTSRARTFWLISTVTSPSEKRPTVAAPKRNIQMAGNVCRHARVGIAGKNHEIRGLGSLHAGSSD
jgi:hypothetical protein